jgi:5-methyltetrahydropteroyltriglutamate--homocysteine methyltransferase
MIEARADVVGSLIRPAELLEAQKRLAADAMSVAELEAVENRAVDRAIALQEEVGLEVVTDGEMRRQSFQSQMTAAVEGFGEHGLDAFLWGHWRGDSSLGDWKLPRPAQLGVVSKLRRRRWLSAGEFLYLREHTRRIAKITLPSPSLWANFWSPEVSSDAYPTLESFLADVTTILCEEVRELARLGARYIQLDAPQYALLLDPRTSSFYERLAGGRDRWLALAIDADNAVLDAAPPEMTRGFHLCRGNQGGRWLARGGYEPLAPTLFPRIRAHRLLLEYDDARSGSFEALAHVPEDKLVVLGLVSTKRAALESPEELIRRVGEAARQVPLERLALGPQCGFSTSILAGPLTEADERRKLELLVRTARRLWN